jgi:hypothetical protein
MNPDHCPIAKKKVSFYETRLLRSITLHIKIIFHLSNLLSFQLGSKLIS